ncbi:MAG: endonuclease domain-containing protein [Pedobacter sp.]
MPLFIRCFVPSPSRGRLGWGWGSILIAQTNENILSNRRQRALRVMMTDAEQMLWRFLRGRQVSGVKFRRQHPFGDYILDFVSLEIKLVIEVDGGHHNLQAQYDKQRTLYLNSAGFQVLRFWNNEVIQEIEAVKEIIWMTVHERQPHPPPDLPLERGGNN